MIVLILIIISFIVIILKQCSHRLISSYSDDPNAIIIEHNFYSPSDFQLIQKYCNRMIRMFEDIVSVFIFLPI